jgi:phage baseplate assembly protein W
MAKINFKSVGMTRQQEQDSFLASSATPIGIKTPLQLSNDSGLLEMHYSLSNQLSDNLRNLLLTNWGERVGQYTFGANLKPLTTEFVSQDDFDSEAVIRIKSSVSRWMPFIDLVDFASETDRLENLSTGIIRVTISYNIPALNVSNKKLQIVLYVM